MLDPREVETNIVTFELCEKMPTAREFVERLRPHGVWMLATGLRQVRAVTHLDVFRGGVDRAIAVCRAVCQELA